MGGGCVWFGGEDDAVVAFHAADELPVGAVRSLDAELDVAVGHDMYPLSYSHMQTHVKQNDPLTWWRARRCHHLYLQRPRCVAVTMTPRYG